MSGYTYHYGSHVPSKSEKAQYLKAYFTTVFVAACAVVPLVIYFANMKP